MDGYRAYGLIALCAILSFATGSIAAPFYRAGEWQSRTDNGPPNLICHQSDHTLDQAALTRMFSGPGQKCSPGQLTTIGPVTTVSVTCQMAGGSLTTSGTITAQGPDAYISRLHAHLTGGKMTIPDMDITQVAKRLGACRPGDRPSPY